MLRIVTLLALACVCSAFSHSDEQVAAEFSAFTQRFNRTYASPHERAHRLKIFTSNLETIIKHNFQDPAPSFTMGINQFADLTGGEFAAIVKGARPPVAKRRVVRATVAPSAPAPPSLDWRTKIYIAPPTSGGQCDANWATVPVDMMSGDVEIKSGVLMTLSWQEAIDCVPGSQGCGGGFADSVFQFVIANGGLQSDATYPNTGGSEQCMANKTLNVMSLSSYTDIAAGDEGAIMTAIQTQLVTIAVDASGPNFQFYSSGVLTGLCTKNLDHLLLLVGYGTLDGVDYWTLRNDWGESWGMNGYILIVRNQDECGFADGAAFATVN